MKQPTSIRGSSLYGAAAPEKKHSSITHLLKSTQFEIAANPPEQHSLEVLMWKSAFVARQKSTPQRSPTRCHSSASAEALPGHREQVCMPSVGRHRGQGCDGEADGVSKIGSEEHAKRVQEEFSSIAPFFVEKGDLILGRRG